MAAKTETTQNTGSTTEKPEDEKSTRDFDNAHTQPDSLIFTGRLNQDDRLLTIADIFQRSLGDHLLYPPNFYRDEPIVRGDAKQ